MPLEFKLPDLLQNLHGKLVELKCACGHVNIRGHFQWQPETEGRDCTVGIHAEDMYGISVFKSSDVESITIHADQDVPTIKLTDHN